MIINIGINKENKKVIKEKKMNAIMQKYNGESSKYF